jgi:hypothetical protein
VNARTPGRLLAGVETGVTLRPTGESAVAARRESTDMCLVEVSVAEEEIGRRKVSVRLGVHGMMRMSGIDAEVAMMIGPSLWRSIATFRARAAGRTSSSHLQGGGIEAGVGIEIETGRGTVTGKETGIVIGTGTETETETGRGRETRIEIEIGRETRTEIGNEKERGIKTGIGTRRATEIRRETSASEMAIVTGSTKGAEVRTKNAIERGTKNAAIMATVKTKRAMEKSKRLAVAVSG